MSTWGALVTLLGIHGARDPTFTRFLSIFGVPWEPFGLQFCLLLGTFSIIFSDVFLDTFRNPIFLYFSSIFDSFLSSFGNPAGKWFRCSRCSENTEITLEPPLKFTLFPIPSPDPLFLRFLSPFGTLSASIRTLRDRFSRDCFKYVFVYVFERPPSLHLLENICQGLLE